MGAHINERGEWQSDKYEEWCKPDFVPLKVTDRDAQPFLWGYAALHEGRDSEFSEDLRARLRAVGYDPKTSIAEAETMTQVLTLLSEHAGEAGESEGAVDVLRRLIWEAGREPPLPGAERPDSLRNAIAGAEWQIYECYGCGSTVEATMAAASATAAVLTEARCPSCGERMTHKASWPTDVGGYGSRTDLERIVGIGPDGYYRRTELRQRPGQKIQLTAIDLLVDGEPQRIDYPEPIDAEDPYAPVCLPVYVPHAAPSACSSDDIEGEALRWWEQAAERQHNLSPKHASLHAYRSGACRHGATPVASETAVPPVSDLEEQIIRYPATSSCGRPWTPDKKAAAPAGGADAYHGHLEGCRRCSDRPFDLCPDGTGLLQVAAAGSGALPDFPPPPPPPRFTSGAEVEISEGSALEWDTLADIRFSGTGAIVRIIKNSRGDLSIHDSVWIWVDSSEHLQRNAKHVRQAFDDGSIGGLSWPGDGLGGVGGFVFVSGQRFSRSVQRGEIRVLPGRRNPETYRPALQAWLEKEQGRYPWPAAFAREASNDVASSALPDFPPPPPPPSKVVKLWQKDAEVEAAEGSRLEWDLIEGIVAPGTGVIAGIIHSKMEDNPFPNVFCIWVDPNDRLRELSPELREAFKYNTWPGDGLDGDGGFIFATGWNFCMAVQRGQVRVLPDRCDPEPYRTKLRLQQAKTGARRHGIALADDGTAVPFGCRSSSALPDFPPPPPPPPTSAPPDEAETKKRIFRSGRFYGKWIGEERDERSESGCIPYPDHFEIWEKIGDYQLVVDQEDARALRKLLDELIAAWPGVSHELPCPPKTAHAIILLAALRDTPEHNRVMVLATELENTWQAGWIERGALPSFSPPSPSSHEALARRLASYALDFVESSCGPDVDALSERFGEILAAEQVPEGSTGRGPSSPSLCPARDLLRLISVKLPTMNARKRHAIVLGDDGEGLIVLVYLGGVIQIVNLDVADLTKETLPLAREILSLLGALPDFPPPPPPGGGGR